MLHPQRPLMRRMTMATLMTKTCWPPLLALRRLALLQVVLRTAMAAGKPLPCIWRVSLYLCSPVYRRILAIGNSNVVPCTAEELDAGQQCLFTSDGGFAVQNGRVSATYSFWQHLTGHVTGSQRAVLHDGAGSHSRTAEALPLQANL